MEKKAPLTLQKQQDFSLHCVCVWGLGDGVGVGVGHEPGAQLGRGE